MNSFFSIIKLDYLQRTRSYNFLITLCASLAIAYTFVPEPNANYSTIRIANYVGFYNSAWFGYVTAIMSSIFLSLIGFYLINSGIKKDIETKVGHIIASTKTNNLLYLLAKVFSNYLILLTILFIIFLMSLILFFLYNDDFSIDVLQFVKPYILIPVPALFLIAVLGVTFEVILGKHSILQNIIFFFLFTLLMISKATSEMQFAFDPFGTKIVIHHMEETVRQIKDLDENINMSVGYIIGNVKNTHKFQFDGVEFSSTFLISRFLWILLSFVLIIVITPFFHRFNIKEKRTPSKKEIDNNHLIGINNIKLTNLPKTGRSYSIFPLIKTEFLLLFRKGKRWLWFVNILGAITLSIVPLKTAHQIVLPILWFLQVHRLSDITTREVSNNIHYFTFSSFKPLKRIFLSQIIASMLLMTFLTIPILIRLLLVGNFNSVFSIILGIFFIVSLAAFLGLFTKGKKLFEVLFFIITYMNINSLPFADYYGAINHSSNYILTLGFCSLSLWICSYLLKRKTIKNL